ncbi:MAG: BatD family protein [Spirochaetaceae bacterium]
MGNKSPKSRCRKRLVVFLLLLLPQIGFAFEMNVLPDKPLVGRVITLKVLTDIPAEKNLTVGNLILPNNINKISGPIITPYWAKKNGVSIRSHQVTWALRSRDTGIYSLPNVEFKSENYTYDIKVPTIMVFNADERNNNFPLVVDWNKDIKSTIYVGESLPIIIEAYNLEALNFADNVVSKPPNKGEIIEVSGLGVSTPETVVGNSLYRVSVRSWIYTALEVGAVKIPSVRVDINGLTRYTEPLELKVLPLPEVNATGGVGQFIIQSEVDSTQVTPEDIFHYKVRISGQGNLPYIKYPNVDFSGIILIDKTETSSIGHSENGFLGWKELDFTLQALEPGVKEIRLSEVSWINTNGFEIFFNGSVSNINVVSVKVVEEDILPFLSFMTTPEIISSYTVFLYKKPFMWGLLFLSPFLLLIMKFSKTIKLNRERKTLLITAALIPFLLLSSIFAKGFEYQGDLVVAENFINSGEYERALEVYNKLSDKLPNNYGIFVNKAILCDRLGDIAHAVYNIRIAERIVPDNKKVHQVKLYLSDSEEFNQKQAKTSNPINPDYIFLILITFFNILFIVSIRLIKIKSITAFSMFFTIILFTLLATIFLIYVDMRNSIQAGVIDNGGALLTKVPSQNALDWMTLGEGHCVYIIGDWESKYLIETEYGLQGWVEKDSLLVFEER